MNAALKTLAGAVGGIAPTLATMLGGPFAGMAVTALESAFGLKSGDGAEAITKVIQTGGMTPDTLAAVRAADQKHAEIMGQQGIDLAKLNAEHEQAFAEVAAADRASARSREVAVRDRTPAHIAYIVILGFFAISVVEIVGMVVWPEQVAKMPSDGWLLVGTIFGYLANEAKAAGAYYFGTTQDSGKKTEALVDIAKTP